MNKLPRSQESIEELAYRASMRAMDFSNQLMNQDKIKFMDSVIDQFSRAREALNNFEREQVNEA